MIKNIGYIIVFICIWSFVFYKIHSETQAYDGPRYELNIVIKVEQTDELSLYYRTLENDFSEKRKVMKVVKNKRSFQNLSLDFPLNTSHIRIDISSNEKQSKTTIKQFTINRIEEKGVKTKSYNALQISQLFKPNEFITNRKLIDNNVELRFKKQDGKYDPYFEEVNVRQLMRN